MPSPLPPLPDPTETTKPVPRIEWLQQVQSFFDNAREQSDSIRLIFDGDSVTRGWRGGNGRTVWLERYEHLGAFNFAVGGDGAQHLLWRLSQGQLNGLDPQLAVLLIGTNNARDNTPEKIAEGVRAVVEEYRKQLPNTVILLQGIFPRGQAPSDPLRDKVKEANQILSALADGEKVIFTDFGDRFLEPDGTISPEIMADFLHLTPKAYEIWADAIQPVIDKYVPAPTAE